MGWNTPDDCPWPSDADYYNERYPMMEETEPAEMDEFEWTDEFERMFRQYPCNAPDKEY